MIEQKLTDALKAYADHLKASYEAWNKPQNDDRDDIRAQMISEFAVEFEEGNKYIRVVTHMAGHHRSSHSFIVNTDKHARFKYGDILKSASWKTPAMNFSRGNVFDTNSYNAHRWAGI